MPGKALFIRFICFKAGAQVQALHYLYQPERPMVLSMNKKQLFNNFITANLDHAYRFAFTFVKNEKDAEDIVSESVVKALRSINKLKKPQYMKTWFFNIISNTAFTYLKQKSRLSIAEEAEMDVMQSFQDDYSHITIADIISLLDEKRRFVIVLRFLEGMKINEIAKILDISESTVKTRLYSALKLLRISLEEDYESL